MLNFTKRLARLPFSLISNDRFMLKTSSLARNYFCTHKSMKNSANNKSGELSHRIFNHSFEFVSGKWHVEIAFFGDSLVLVEDTIRMSYGGYNNCLIIKLVDNQTRFQKGRKTYMVGFNVLQSTKLAHWKPELETFEIVRSSENREEAVSIDTNAQKDIDVKVYNNREEEQKRKEFTIKSSEFKLLQQLIQSGLLCMNQQTYRLEWEAYQLEQRIKNRDMSIDPDYTQK